MGKAAGAKVIATARGRHKADQALALGADIAIDATADDFEAIAREAGGVDVVLDMVGGSYFAKNLAALNTGGRIVYIASLGGGTVELPIGAMMMKRATITGSTLRPRSADEKSRLASEVERVVWPWIEAGQLKTVIDHTFPLADAAKAHALMDQPHLGKVVLTI
jgi:NADPH:quinone reductase-like Zn-dependent oxidoreductase